MITNRRRLITHRSLLASGTTVLALTLGACGHDVSTPAASGSTQATTHGATVTDCGEKVSVTQPPRRVVTLTPGLSDLVKRLGAGGRVVGEAQNASGRITPGLAAGAKVISDVKPPAREKLLSLDPDLVVSPTGYEFSADQGFASKEQVKKAGGAAYVSTGGCLMRRSSSEVSDLLTDIDNLGALLATPDEARTLHATAQRSIDDVGRAVAGRTKPTVVQVYVDGDSLSAVGAGVEHDIIARAGGKNLFNPTDAQFKEFFSAEITKETLLAKNPDVIVYSGPDAESRAHSRDFLKRTFPGVPAVKNDRLVELSSDDLMPGVWGNLDALRTVAKGLHPDVTL